MNISDKTYDGVKQRYRYSEWSPAAAASLGTVRSFLPQVADRHTLTLEKRVPMMDLPGAFSEHYVSVTDPGVRVLVDIAIYPSIATAHEALLHILSRVSAPTLPSGVERGLEIGDVAFAGHEELVTAVLFVRRNVVVDIQSAGFTPVTVAELALDIDAQIKGLSRAD
jgi:hypothetical protein